MPKSNLTKVTGSTDFNYKGFAESRIQEENILHFAVNNPETQFHDDKIKYLVYLEQDLGPK